MLILSVGMPRAGSGWYYNLTHDLIVSSGGQDARQVRARYHLQGVLTEVNCNIGALTLPRLSAVLIPSILGNTFVIKAHAGPTAYAKILIKLGLMRTAYIYRDPRDAMISAYDNGQRALKKGRPNAFSHLVDFDASLRFIRDYVRISEAWLALQPVLHTRYEDLVGEYDREAARMLEFFHLDPSNESLKDVIAKYRPEHSPAIQKGMHFNLGVSGRFRQKTTPEQQEILAASFKPYLEKLGYPI